MGALVYFIQGLVGWVGALHTWRAGTRIHPRQAFGPCVEFVAESVDSVPASALPKHRLNFPLFGELKLVGMVSRRTVAISICHSVPRLAGGNRSQSMCS